MTETTQRGRTAADDSGPACADGPARRRSPARAAMIDAAERIVAERGLSALSLKSVQEAAGQANKSAANYHFGSRDGLIGAVLADRMATIGERRRRMLDAIDAREADGLGRARDAGDMSEVSDSARAGNPNSTSAAGAAADPHSGGSVLRDVVEALVRPLAERVFAVEGSAYARFLVQAAVSPELARIISDRAVMPTVDETLGRIVGLLARDCGMDPPGAGLLRPHPAESYQAQGSPAPLYPAQWHPPQLDPDTVRWRTERLLGHVIGALAAAEARIGSDPGSDPDFDSAPPPEHVLTARLVDTCLGLLTAPDTAREDTYPPTDPVERAQRERTQRDRTQLERTQRDRRPS